MEEDREIAYRRKRRSEVWAYTKRGLFEFFGGAFFIAMGAGGTYLTHKISKPGGIYFIYYGAIAAGVLLCFKGLNKILYGPPR